MGIPRRRSMEIQDFQLWEKLKKKRVPLSFDFELTARCNNNCSHCYINVPANDYAAKSQELTFDEIMCIVDEAQEMGVMWCLITGGEPLLRDDFNEIYLALKRKGLLISVFTNAVLLNEKTVRLFKKFPPRDIEITVYGVTRDTYERVTQCSGSFEGFSRGVHLLESAGLKARYKAMAIRSNIHEISDIKSFCEEKTKDFFHCDSMLHLRFDGNQRRNEEILAERLDPQEIINLDTKDEERKKKMQLECSRIVRYEKLPVDECLECEKEPECERYISFTHLFNCGAGTNNFVLGFDGMFRLCSSLYVPEMMYNLRQGTLHDAWENLVPRVRELRTSNVELLKSCLSCPHFNFCLWCPAHAYLETGKLENPIPYFCEIAKARSRLLVSEPFSSC